VGRDPQFEKRWIKVIVIENWQKIYNYNYIISKRLNYNYNKIMLLIIIFLITIIIFPTLFPNMNNFCWRWKTHWPSIWYM